MVEREWICDFEPSFLFLKPNSALVEMLLKLYELALLGREHFFDIPQVQLLILQLYRVRGVMRCQSLLRRKLGISERNVPGAMRVVLQLEGSHGPPEFIEGVLATQHACLQFFHLNYIRY